MPTQTAPTLQLEQELWQSGYQTIAGCDEAGKGAWAGPVTVGVVVPPADDSAGLEAVRDSKMLSESTREQLFGEIDRWCQAWAVGHALPQECDSLGMSAAQELATMRAFQKLRAEPEFVLVDGKWNFIQACHSLRLPWNSSQPLPPPPAQSKSLVKGDQISLSIAAASVMAKVSRDRLMREVSEVYPEFDFPSNKGYPSPKHLAALESNGVTPIHRQSWSYMDKMGLRQNR